jgi:Spy/CpxP family protein refolding chaperone
MRGRMIVVMCAFTLILSAADAFCGPDSTSRAGDSVHQKWWAQLNLTPDQKARLKALHSDLKDFRKANFEKMKSMLDKSKEELLKPAPSKAALYTYAQQMGDLHRAMAERMADHMLQMKTILSKEQFQKFLNRDFMRGAGGRGNGPRPPHGGPHGLGPPPPGDMDD